MKFNKKLSKSGGLTLPAAMRRDLGINHGERFSIESNTDGSIMLKRMDGECIFCKTDHELLTHMGRYVCKTCREIISNKEGA